MPVQQDLQPLLDIQQNQLNLVFSDSNGIDAKALAILGANIAVLIFINQTAPHLTVWKFVALYGPFVLSFLMDVVSMWPREYLSAAPDLEKSPGYLSLEPEALLLQLLSNTQAAIQRNTALNTKRLRACSVSLLLTSLGFLVLLFIL